ncbi:MAG: hypothetical protein ACOCW2_03995, partial [Chitinivibrionales bacterium]
EGLPPTDSSAVYEDTITLSRSTTLTMFAQKPYFSSSDISSSDYYCTRMVKRACYEDRDGDGRIETAVIELDGHISHLPDTIHLKDPISEREHRFDSTHFSRLAESEGSGSVFLVSIKPPFESGTHIAYNQWGRIPLSGDYDISPFTVLDKAAPVISSATLRSAEQAFRDSLLITFSEPVLQAAVSGKYPDEVFAVTGPLQESFEACREPIGRLNDSTFVIVFPNKTDFSVTSSSNTIRLQQHVRIADRFGNTGTDAAGSVEIAVHQQWEWKVLAISPFRPGVDQVPEYVSALPGIHGNTGTVIMIPTPNMPPATASIYDATGNVIRKNMEFVRRSQDKKQYLVWDGKSNRGDYVSSGTYLVSVRITDKNSGINQVKYIKIAVKDR